MADKRLYFFSNRNGTDAPVLVEGASRAEAGRILLEHLYDEPRVASVFDVMEQMGKGTKVVRAGE